MSIAVTIPPSEEEAKAKRPTRIHLAYPGAPDDWKSENWKTTIAKVADRRTEVRWADGLAPFG